MHYLCPICNKKCEDKRSFNKHSMTHYKEAVWELAGKPTNPCCDICGSKFTYRSKLLYHVAFTHKLMDRITDLWACKVDKVIQFKLKLDNVSPIPSTSTETLTVITEGAAGLASPEGNILAYEGLDNVIDLNQVDADPKPTPSMQPTPSTLPNLSTLANPSALHGRLSPWVPITNTFEVFDPEDPLQISVMDEMEGISDWGSYVVEGEVDFGFKKWPYSTTSIAPVSPNQEVEGPVLNTLVEDVESRAAKTDLGASLGLGCGDGLDLTAAASLHHPWEDSK